MNQHIAKQLLFALQDNNIPHYFTDDYNCDSCGSDYIVVADLTQKDYPKEIQNEYRICLNCGNSELTSAMLNKAVNTIKNNEREYEQNENGINIVELNEPNPEKTNLKESVRPKGFNEIYGNEEIINDLKILIESSKKRDLSLDHILFFGPPGLGKTTIGSVISSERGVGFKPITGSNVDKKALIEVLKDVKKLDVLFIDEIHALNNDCSLALFTAMEDSYIDITTNGEAFRYTIPPFTVIGGTTDPGKILAPMRDRFPIKYHLKLYENEDLIMIIGNAAKKLNVGITKEAALMIATRSRGTPRNSISLLKKTRAYADVHNADYKFSDGRIGPCVNKMITEMVFDSVKIDKNGLNEMDREYMKILKNMGTSGLKTLSSAMNEADDNITEMIEPWLISQGYVKRTPRGRELTKKGESILNPSVC